MVPNPPHTDAEHTAALSHQMAAHLTLEQQQHAWYLQQQQYFLQQQQQQLQHMQTVGGQQQLAAVSSVYSMQQQPMYGMPYSPPQTSAYPMQQQQQASHTSSIHIIRIPQQQLTISSISSRHRMRLHSTCIRATRDRQCTLPSASSPQLSL